MKHIFLFRFLIITYFLFTGCSPKKAFYFSKSTGSFGAYQKVPQEANLPDNLVTPDKITDLKQANRTTPPVFTATTATAINPAQLPLPEKTYSGNFSASIPARVVKMPLHKLVVKTKARQKNAVEKYLEDPVADKKVQGAVLAGFLLFCVALGFFFAFSWPMAALLGLISSILGIVGLVAIKRNPGKYLGKVLAWIPIILGFLLTLFITIFVVSYAGGI